MKSVYKKESIKISIFQQTRLFANELRIIQIIMKRQKQLSLTDSVKYMMFLFRKVLRVPR